MLRKFSITLAVPFAAGAGAALTCMPASAQDTHQILDGYWNPLFDEDRPERGPGPDQGDNAVQARLDASKRPATSDQATFDEHMFRDAQILTDVTMITDPEYLSEPLVKSTEYLKVENTIEGREHQLPDISLPGGHRGTAARRGRSHASAESDGGGAGLSAA